MRKRIIEPSLVKLINIANNLKGKYDETNLSRVAFNELILSVANDQHIPDTKKRDLLLGLLTLQLEVIKYVEYNGKSPSVKKVGMGIFAKEIGSHLYSYIKNQLGINTDSLTKVKIYFDNDRRMYYLNELYKEFKENPKKYSKYFNAKSNDANTLEETVIKRLIDLKNRSDKEIRVLTEGKPSLDALYRYVEEKNAAYKKIVSERGVLSSFNTSSSHQALLDFVDFVAQTSKHLYKVHDEMSPQEKALKIDEASNAIIAAYLFLLLEIYGKYWIFSPEGTYFFGYKISGSHVFGEGLTAINKSNLQNITDEERVELLSVLFTHLGKVQTLYKLNDPADKELIAKWHKQGFTDIKKFKDSVMSSLVLEHAKRSSTWTASIINGTVHTGLGVSVAGIIAKVGIPLFTAVAVSNPITFAVTGALLLTPMGMSLATKGLSYASDRTIGAVSHKITDATLNVIDKTKEKVDYLFNGEYVKMDDQNYSVWKKMLLELPVPVISNDERRRIADFLGSQEVARLQGFTPTTFESEQVSVKFFI